MGVDVVWKFVGFSRTFTSCTMVEPLSIDDLQAPIWSWHATWRLGKGSPQPCILAMAIERPDPG
ncbi:hypothetical protein A7L03_18825 [Acinetobacter baumannii]|nr:hypothetical protein A7L03_18825 [Acinetobacter baumannii]